MRACFEIENMKEISTPADKNIKISQLQQLTLCWPIQKPKTVVEKRPLGKREGTSNEKKTKNKKQNFSFYLNLMKQVIKKFPMSQWKSLNLKYFSYGFFPRDFLEIISSVWAYFFNKL